MESIKEQYPNIGGLLETFDGGNRQMALLFLAQMPPETVAYIETQVPALLEAQANNDTEFLVTMAMGLGADEATARMAVASAFQQATA